MKIVLLQFRCLSQCFLAIEKIRRRGGADALERGAVRIARDLSGLGPQFDHLAIRRRQTACQVIAEDAEVLVSDRSGAESHDGLNSFGMRTAVREREHHSPRVTDDDDPLSAKLTAYG